MGFMASWSPQLLSDINGALDRAEAENAIVVLAGRPGVFSAGFDLKLLRAGGDEALAMLRAGFEQVREVFTLITGKADLDLYKRR